MVGSQTCCHRHRSFISNSVVLKTAYVRIHIWQCVWLTDEGKMGLNHVFWYTHEYIHNICKEPGLLTNNPCTIFPQVDIQTYIFSSDIIDPVFKWRMCLILVQPGRLCDTSQAHKPFSLTSQQSLWPSQLANTSNKPFCAIGTYKFSLCVHIASVLFYRFCSIFMMLHCNNLSLCSVYKNDTLIQNYTEGLMIVYY